MTEKMSEEERQCFSFFLHWISVLELAVEDEGSQAFAKSEVERLDGYLATIRERVDKLKKRIQ